MPDTPPIIITGGSVTVQLKEGTDEAANQLKPEGGGKFSNASKRIDRVEFTGDDFTYSDGVVTTRNGRLTITVYFK